ncbi:MAG: cobalt-precorrin-5B (C(1))-methyltransferase [Granulosicoccus sp.]|nr:cobalt-precorrin-5B (C(1))-methyltransferase [Granulosicoccus sp.]
MREDSPEKVTKLRSGFSTGACATATSLAAARLLLTEHYTSTASIELPRGEQVDFHLEECVKVDARSARASTIKDAGDDPDVTHKALIVAEVALVEAKGIQFLAGEGVGTVTREGLSLAVGEAAINPVPRAMITAHLSSLAAEQNYTGGFTVTIGVRDGEKLAERTMNARLGILGGLSILGTTGIVRPFSCAAYIASIHQSIDVAHANGLSHIAASTGSTSERYIQQALSLPDMALVEMGDFAGAVLKHLRKVPMEKLSICGGFGKVSKMAAGHTSLHSQHSQIDFSFLAAVAGESGASNELKQRILACNTSLEALKLSEQAGVSLANKICAMAKQTALQSAKENIEIDVYCVNKQGECVGSTTTIA